MFCKLLNNEFNILIFHVIVVNAIFGKEALIKIFLKDFSKIKHYVYLSRYIFDLWGNDCKQSFDIAYAQLELKRFWLCRVQITFDIFLQVSYKFSTKHRALLYRRA